MNDANKVAQSEISIKTRTSVSHIEKIELCLWRSFLKVRTGVIDGNCFTQFVVRKCYIQESAMFHLLTALVYKALFSVRYGQR